MSGVIDNVLLLYYSVLFFLYFLLFQTLDIKPATKIIIRYIQCPLCKCPLHKGYLTGFVKKGSAGSKKSVLYEQVSAIYMFDCICFT